MIKLMTYLIFNLLDSFDDIFGILEIFTSDTIELLVEGGEHITWFKIMASYFQFARKDAVV